VGTRVQTEESSSGEWFAGSVLALHADGSATIVYDDGDEWTGPMRAIYLLQQADSDVETLAGPQAPLLAPTQAPLQPQQRQHQ